jgi:hypothetical protein
MPMDPLSDPNTAFGELKEAKYKAELQLVDRYQSFVAELLHLSLLGIAVFGFLYKEMLADFGPSPLLTITGVAKILAASGVLAFAVAAVAALIFRFSATEGARYYIEALRFPTDMKRAKKSLDTRLEKVHVARRTKATAGIMLGLGGVLVALALTLLLSEPVPPQTDHIPEQINKLAELRDSGVITGQEFEEKKSQLLDRL